MKLLDAGPNERNGSKTKLYRVQTQIKLIHLVNIILTGVGDVTKCIMDL